MPALDPNVFYNRIKEKFPDIEILGEYVNCNTKIKVRHKICGYIWDAPPTSLHMGHGCPKCGNSLRKDPNIFKKELFDINPNIELVTEYVSVNKKVKVKCLTHNYIWEASPSNLLRGTKCPVCTGRVALKGVNDISTTAPNILKYITNINDAYTHTCNSHDKIHFTCPDCGHIEMKTIKNVFRQGFCCSVCGDGISYPNKFARAFLKQLPVDYLDFEYSPEWITPKRYDNYFEYQNKKYILEMDGDFHFKDNRMNSITKEQIKKDDYYKNHLAMQNGIYVIRIDCRQPNAEYIINKINDSVLAFIFNLNIVDWNQCDFYATSNFAKEVCEFYQINKDKMSYKDIQKYFSISEQTFIRYKKQGLKFGWCTCSKEDDSLTRSLGSNDPRSIPVSVYIDNEWITFKSINLCRKVLEKQFNTKFSNSGIKNAILNNKPFKDLLFKYA